MEAFSTFRHELKTISMFYVGICEDQVESTYIERNTQDMLALKMQEGAIPHVGSLAMKDLSEEELEPFAPPPKMNKLIITHMENEKKQLQIPADLVKNWSLHPIFGTQFSLWLDGFLKDPEHKILQPKTETEDVVAGSKRGHGDDGHAVGQASPKKRKAPSKVLEGDFIV